MVIIQTLNVTPYVYRCSVVQTMVAESPLTSVSMMHDGTTLAVGSIRGKVYIYDLRKGSTPLKVIAAHKSSVKCMSFEVARNKARVRYSQGRVSGSAICDHTG